MPPLAAALGAGLVAGAVASFAMSIYQGAAAEAFEQDHGDDDPATVKAADRAKEATIGRPVAKAHRKVAGGVVHYLTGAVLGIGYGALVFYWPTAAVGFGVAFGIVVALVLDDVLVPAFGWGPWPWKTDLTTHAYSLSSHVVFGAVLEGVRRLGIAMLG